jgi:predicted nucleotidyltransferase component of viral defense system
MLQYKTIDSKTLELLKQIQAVKIFNNLRLVGGTSLALQIGHRISVDLDLFGNLDADRINIVKELQKLGEVKTIHYTDNINIFLVNGIKVDIVNYHYPWLASEIIIDDILLASKKDIAAMKLSAITGRGTMKDFIDLFYLLKQFSLKQIIEFYEQKYIDGSVFLVLKSLSYFDDADKDIMPRMFDNTNWEEIKKYISKELKLYV